MFEAILYEGTMVVAQIHESLMHLNDNFELYFGDKDMHFIVMAVLGMILFFMVHSCSSGWRSGALRPFRSSMCSR